MNKGVKHPPDNVETLTASVDFNGPNPQKNGARVIYPRPAHTNC